MGDGRLIKKRQFNTFNRTDRIEWTAYDKDGNLTETGISYGDTWKYPSKNLVIDKMVITHYTKNKQSNTLILMEDRSKHLRYYEDNERLQREVITDKFGIKVLDKTFKDDEESLDTYYYDPIYEDDMSYDEIDNSVWDFPIVEVAGETYDGVYSYLYKPTDISEYVDVHLEEFPDYVVLTNRYNTLDRGLLALYKLNEVLTNHILELKLNIVGPNIEISVNTDKEKINLIAIDDTGNVYINSKSTDKYPTEFLTFKVDGSRYSIWYDHVKVYEDTLQSNLIENVEFRIPGTEKNNYILLDKIWIGEYVLP